jgi:carboxyl-terminal processing protease
MRALRTRVVAPLLTLVATAAGAGDGASPPVAAGVLADGASTSAADPRLREAAAIIAESYLEPVTAGQVVDRALRSLLQGLDPYSHYLDAKEWAAWRAELAAAFGGVGVALELSAEAGVPRIRHLMVGSAAGAAGARPRDLVLAVDGRSTQGLTLDEVLPSILGEPGTPVRLTLQREAEVFDLVVERRLIKAPSVRGVSRDANGAVDYLLDAEEGIGYIRISHLAEDTVATVEAALTELRQRQMKSLVLDLRDSRGGLMRAAIGVADLFVDHGRLLTQVSRVETTPYDATPGVFTDFPIVALINAGTASSSEFLAAALQDNGRARFLGQRTYGKARIQEMFALGEGEGGLILTTGRFERPSGRAVDRHDSPVAPEQAGVAPDPGLEMIVEGEEYDAWRAATELLDSPAVLVGADVPHVEDRVLVRAIEILSGHRRVQRVQSVGG